MRGSSWSWPTRSWRRPDDRHHPDAGARGQELGGLQRILDTIERLGNKVPHPAIIFIGLCVLVIVLSAVLAVFDVSVTYEVAEQPDLVAEQEDLGGSIAPDIVLPEGEQHLYDDVEIVTETTEAQSIISRDGIRFLFSSFVGNFAGFTVVAVVFVAMIGVGVAEEAGLMGALIRKLVAVAPAASLTFIIVFVGGLSSVATDAGYLILIPLGAAAFASVGRNPLVGLAAAYAGVSAGFAVNALITPLDSLLTEVTNEAIALAEPDQSIGLTANLWFSIASTFFVAVVITLVAEKITTRSLGTYTPEPAVAEAGAVPIVEVAEEAEVPEGEAKGLRYASIGTLVAIGVVVLLTVIPDAPLRNPETGSIIDDSPLMESLIFIITSVFLVAGICFGIGAKTITNSVDVINAIVKTFSGLASLVFLLLIISQFIAYFNYSEMPTIIAVNMADFLEGADIGALWLLIGFILVIVHPRHRDPRFAAEVGDLRPDLHPAVHPPRRGPADGAGGLPVGRLPRQRDHAADGVPAVHRAGGAALQEGRRHRHDHRPDDPLHDHRADHLVAVLRGLVPDRHPVRPGLPGHALREAT